ncbi:hypothetical protein A4H97_05340 [Niastella yeongjuensis]|uniref:DUF748 domain-containing protein n=1 Tax=Niastella yeongjuensis TaxID=354355 RepID=A0A1V9EM46_9BACT|nr:hypothetical protein [Niastella yeongjuensis]OQP46945.1 hypothetical protein A4H97_05340 [Niastella yeongjuensis]SEN61860.1 hypothetical protein SAMN05660816_01092 [Niastella yeongjuensis]
MKKLIFLLILVLLVAAGLIYYKKWRSDLLQKKVPQLVFLKSDSLYRITYDSVDIDEVEGEIVIRNLQLFPDSTYKKPTDSTLPRNLLQITVPEIYISGVQTDAAVLNKEVIATKIKLTRPVVTMFNNNHVEKDKDNDPTPTSFKIYQILLRGLEKIKVDTILITDADYHICQWPKGDTIFSGSKINAQLHHINISDSTSTDTSRVLFAEQASLDVADVLIHSRSHLYNYRFKSIQLLSGERSFAVKSMHITPQLGEAAFAKAAKRQTDRLDFDFYNLLFKQVNVQEILNGNLIANELLIKNAEFKVYRDKNYPDKKESLIGHYPQQSFLQIPVNVAIKKVVIQQGFIHYKEMESITGNSGLVIFDDMHATLHNVTNNPADIRKNGICTVNFNSLFLRKVPVSATLQLYLNSKNGKFTINGNIKSLDATILNSLSKPMALVEVSSGNITSLDFNFIGNDNRIKGLVRLLYDDLKIKVLKKDEDGDKEYKTKKVMSLMANIAVINANPAKNKPVRIVTVTHPRNKYRSLFNFIWKSIFEGVQKTVGIDGKL